MELEFDPRQPAFRADPHRHLRVLRERDPVHHSAVMNAWVLTRHADVLRAATDTASFGNDTLARLVGPRAAAMAASARERIGVNLGMADGAVHARLRAAVHPFFTPRALDGLAAPLEAFVAARLDDAAARRSLDVVRDLSRPLAVEAVALLLGLPPPLPEALPDQAEATTRISDPLLGRDERRANFARVAALVAYLEALIERRRRAPADDLVSRLAAIDPEQLSRGELVATCLSIIGGGVDTVSMAVSRGVLALLDHPREAARLRAAPELLRNGVEELLRFCAPAVFVGRVTLAPVELGGRRIPAGELVYYSPAAACRDPAVFADPDRLDVGRRIDPGANLAFGHGVHYCLGAALARLECRIAYGALLSRFPRLALAVPRTELVYNASLISMSLQSLPVAL